MVVKKIALALGSLALAFCLLEVLVRVFHPVGAERAPEFQMHERIGWVRAPNQHGFRYQRSFLVPNLFGVGYATNSRGMRDREYRLEKHGRPRVLVLGDSMVEGWGVEEFEAFPKVLESQFLQSAEVWNLGVAGYSTDMELQLLREVIDSYQPDMVIVAFYENDLFCNIQDKTPWLLWTKPLFEIRGDDLVLTNGSQLLEQKRAADLELTSGAHRLKELIKSSALFRFINFAARRTRLKLSAEGEDQSQGKGLGFWFPDNAYRVEESAEGRNAWRMTERLLVEINRLCASQHAHFVLTYVPRALEVVPGILEQEQKRIGADEPLTALDRGKPERKLQEIAQRNGILFAAMGPAFAAFPQPERLYLPQIMLDGHMSPLGHLLVAQTLADFLRERGLLPTGNFLTKAVTGEAPSPAVSSLHAATHAEMVSGKAESKAK